MYDSGTGGARKRSTGTSCAEAAVTEGLNLFKDDFTSGTLGTDDGYIYDCNSSDKCTQFTDLGYFDDTSDILYVNDGTNKFTAINGESGGKLQDNSAPLYFLTKANELVKCTGAIVATCGKVTIASGYYINSGVSGTNIDAIISCSSDTCELIDGEDQYILNAGSDKDTKPFIKCEGSGCVVNDEPKAAAGYYITNPNSANIIKCVDDNEITCTSSAHVGSSTVPKYFIEGKTNKLIKCVESATFCVVQEKTMKGYYIDGTTNSSTMVISCNGETCSSIQEAQTCSKVGQVIKKTDNKYYLCISTSDSDAILLKKDSGEDDEYKTITLANGSDFPGNGSTKTITVKIDKEGRAFLLEENKLPECGTNCQGTGNGKYCTAVEGGKLKIKIRSGDACGTITLNTVFGSSDAGDYPAYFDDTYAVVAKVSAGSATMSYICTLADNGGVAIDSCELVKGYNTIGENVIYCSNWIGEKCVTTANGSVPPCTFGNVNIGTSKASCVGSGDDNSNIQLPTGSETKYVIFYNEEPNIYYGVAGSRFVSLAMTKTTLTVTTKTGKYKLFNIKLNIY